MAGKRPSRGMAPGTMQLAGLGLELAGAVVGACLLGYWIDRHYGTWPKGLIICSILGVVGGLYNLLRQSFRLTDRRKRDGEETRRTDGQDR